MSKPAKICRAKKANKSLKVNYFCRLIFSAYKIQTLSVKVNKPTEKTSVKKCINKASVKLFIAQQAHLKTWKTKEVLSFPADLDSIEALVNVNRRY